MRKRPTVKGLKRVIHMVAQPGSASGSVWSEAAAVIIAADSRTRRTRFRSVVVQPIEVGLEAYLPRLARRRRMRGADFADLAAERAIGDEDRRGLIGRRGGKVELEPHVGSLPVGLHDGNEVRRPRPIPESSIEWSPIRAGEASCA